MCYQVGFCFWLLSFDQEIAEEINKYALHSSLAGETLMAYYRKFDIIPVLTDIAKAAVKEKVIRIIIATFRVSTSEVK